LGYIIAVIGQIKVALSKQRYDGKELDNVEAAIEDIDKILLESISSKKLSYSDYLYTTIHSELGKIRQRANSPWIQSIKNQTLIVYGQGGCGKTHLLAKLAEARLSINTPTLFFLGRLITDTENPLSQILKILDVHCKKELFLRALNDYGKKHGQILIIVDGLNEGKGLSIWRPHLLSFINEFKNYENITLILSVRVNSNGNWFSQFIEKELIQSFKHTGFEHNASGAIEYMFRSFNVPLPSWPLFQPEFRNPLLLTLFCRTHSGDTTPTKFESRWEIIRNYLIHFNTRLSELFSYSPNTFVLQNTLSAISETLVNSERRWSLSRQSVLEILDKTQGVPDNKGQFLDALVDEGLLNEYDGKNETFYSFGYDTVGAYIIADALAKDVPFERLINNTESVLEALTELVPEYRDKEFFELSDGNSEYSEYLEELFVKGLVYRRSLTTGGNTYILDLLKEGAYNDIYKIVINNLFRTDLPVSIRTLDNLLFPLSMVKRDEIWTQVVSDSFECYEPLLNLAQWGWSASPAILENIQKENLSSLVHLLSWTLSSTFIELRDKASRALINILKNNRDLLLDFISSFGRVNDSYISERVYAVAFGCCTGNSNKDYVTTVAQMVYDTVFKNDIVPEHILIRDYAKCIVDYAIHLKCNIDYSPERVSPPYCTCKKQVYVDTAEILRYKIPYNEAVDHHLIVAQNNILDSMCTEHSSRGMYGDFGRYVFQSALDNWDDNIELISNFGIKMIFEEFGYNASVFKEFDGRHSSWERHGNKIERIGKKYEWLALYRIAAILDDNHFGEEPDRNWKTPTIYHLRRFDPTILMNPDIRDYTTTLPEYRVPEYDLSKGNDEKWMVSWKKMPPIEQYIEYHGQMYDWICLHAYYTVSTDNKTYPVERELWSFVQAFLVDCNNRKDLCSFIDKEGLDGRDSSENTDASESYYREYYWSESYRTQIESQGYIDREYQAGRKTTLYNVQPTYLLYSINEYSDASLNSSKEMILPSPYLFSGLNLSFSVSDGVWLAPDGSVACYDNYWVYGGHGGLFIRKDLLLKYLKENKKSIVWPILMERMYKPGGTYWPRIQVGGYVWMNEKGVIHDKFRSYEPTELMKKMEKCRDHIRKLAYRQKKKLVEKGLIKVSFEERLKMLSNGED